ncbi:hypothetical protein HDV63DRAFT_15068 [Trichoderma sp. SZMC 28014]
MLDLDLFLGLLSSFWLLFFFQISLFLLLPTLFFSSSSSSSVSLLPIPCISAGWTRLFFESSCRFLIFSFSDMCFNSAERVKNKKPVLVIAVFNQGFRLLIIISWGSRTSIHGYQARLWLGLSCRNPQITRIVCDWAYQHRMPSSLSVAILQALSTMGEKHWRHPAAAMACMRHTIRGVLHEIKTLKPLISWSIHALAASAP